MTTTIADLDLTDSIDGGSQEGEDKVSKLDYYRIDPDRAGQLPTALTNKELIEAVRSAVMRRVRALAGPPRLRAVIPVACEVHEDSRPGFTNLVLRERDREAGQCCAPVLLGDA